MLAVLPESAAIKVREITQRDFLPGDYERLKQKLIVSGQPSTLERLDRLCELRNVKHKRPSEVLLDLEIIFHSASLEYVMHMSDYMKKYWWLRALPSAIQQNILPVADTSSLESLITIADHIFSSNPPVDRVCAVSEETPEVLNSTELLPSDSHTSSNPMEPTVAAIQNKGRSNRTQRKEQLLFCQYHMRFGDRARRCVIGCAKYDNHRKN